MQYEMDLFELVSFVISEELLAEDGETFLSEDHLELKPFITPLSPEIGGYKLILEWKFTIIDQYTTNQLFYIEASQDVYILPGENNFPRLVGIMKLSENEFRAVIKKTVKSTILKNLKIPQIEYEVIVEVITTYLSDKG